MGRYLTQVWMPERDKQAYDKETERIAEELSSGIDTLTEWVTEESLNSYQQELRSFIAREDAALFGSEALAAQLNVLVEKRAERTKRFEAMLAEIEAFPEDCSRADVYAFDSRIREAVGQFVKERGKELRRKWSARRKILLTRAALVESAQTGPGQMEIASSPSKAAVYIDGKYLSLTPFRVTELRAGRREIVLKKAGYRDKALSVDVDASGVLNLGIQELEPIMGSVRIEVVGGRATGELEVEIAEDTGEMVAGRFEVVEGFQILAGRVHDIEALKVGKYALVVVVDGRELARSSFVVEEGRTSLARIEL